MKFVLKGTANYKSLAHRCPFPKQITTKPIGCLNILKKEGIKHGKLAENGGST